MPECGNQESNLVSVELLLFAHLYLLLRVDSEIYVLLEPGLNRHIPVTDLCLEIGRKLHDLRVRRLSPRPVESPRAVLPKVGEPRRRDSGLSQSPPRVVPEFDKNDRHLKEENAVKVVFTAELVRSEVPYRKFRQNDDGEKHEESRPEEKLSDLFQTTAQRNLLELLLLVDEEHIVVELESWTAKTAPKKMDVREVLQEVGEFVDLSQNLVLS